MIRVLMAIIVVIFCLSGGSAAGSPQDGTKSQATVLPSEHPPETTKKRAVLAEATRASANKAAEDAAKQKAKGPAEEDVNPSEESAVTEFRPVPPDQKGKDSESDALSIKKDSKSGPLKNIHGTVYGDVNSTGTGERSTGAAVGTSSKSRKTSVYVETQRTRETIPQR